MHLLLLAAALSVDPSAYKAITFGDKPPTVYERDGDALKMTVRRSASALLLPFGQARPVKHVRFDWRLEGKLLVKDAAMQRTKAGDDAVLRLGLLVAGDPPLLPFFAPAWLKAVAASLIVPAARVMFVVAGGPTAPGERWPSPYDGDIDMVAASPAPAAGPWHGAEASLGRTLPLAAVWLMADGDDTGSTFTAWIRRLELD